LQVGGGLSSGLGIRETAIKEAFEEANVPQDIAMKMKSVGIVT
jgi:8-oxo-dGTP pyrophosphatase MutT (NUDIX family)